MNLIFISYESDDYDQDDVDSFWDQNICMDDWDYIILAPVNVLTEVDAKNWEDKPIKKYVASYPLERLRVGCCDNVWYKGTFRGVEYAVGVAYHA